MKRDTANIKYRIEVYKEVLELLEEDYNNPEEDRLGGYCWVLCHLGHHIGNFPEILELKPKSNIHSPFWWTTKPKRRTRIIKLKQLIQRLES